MLLDAQARFEKQQARFDKENGILLEQIRLLRQQLYGKKSEKMPIGGPQPLPLFDLPEPNSIEPEGKTTDVPAHTRKQGGRKPLPEDLPWVEVIHDIPSEEKICGCGPELSRIGEEALEQLDIVPAKLQVIRHIRAKYACRHCEGLEDDSPAVKISPAVPRLFRNPSPAPASWLIS
ncbi:MAG: IS66 family transposase zinc-finger binding domain-containing protein [Desulfocapsaceae bacterium]|nr:IS66 family transposase zinc-finger binding domain-containing protein [Desulfocapsaceae bacterium]